MGKSRKQKLREKIRWRVANREEIEIKKVKKFYDDLYKKLEKDKSRLLTKEQND